jgi:hypothetical protein
MSSKLGLRNKVGASVDVVPQYLVNIQYSLITKRCGGLGGGGAPVARFGAPFDHLAISTSCLHVTGILLRVSLHCFHVDSLIDVCTLTVFCFLAS